MQRVALLYKFVKAETAQFRPVTIEYKRKPEKDKSRLKKFINIGNKYGCTNTITDAGGNLVFPKDNLINKMIQKPNDKKLWQQVSYEYATDGWSECLNDNMLPALKTSALNYFNNNHFVSEIFINTIEGDIGKASGNFNVTLSNEITCYDEDEMSEDVKYSSDDVDAAKEYIFEGDDKFDKYKSIVLDITVNLLKILLGMY